MENVLKKLALAKQAIKATKMKKAGYNKYSEYAYFTPDQVEQLVFDACQEQSLLIKFDLKRSDIGETGYLTVFDLENPNEVIVFEMATAIPAIKATNVAQQLGGCVTYTERYLKQSAFGIVDNSLDFDTTENTKKQAEPKSQKPYLKQGDANWKKAVDYIVDNGKEGWAYTMSKFNITEEDMEALEAGVKINTSK